MNKKVNLLILLFSTIICGLVTAQEEIKSDYDIPYGNNEEIRNSHTVEIYENIPKAQLCIMPRQTHWARSESPVYFNKIVDKFLEQVFKRPDSGFTKRKK